MSLTDGEPERTQARVSYHSHRRTEDTLPRAPEAEAASSRLHRVTYIHTLRDAPTVPSVCGPHPDPTSRGTHAHLSPGESEGSQDVMTSRGPGAATVARLAPPGISTQTSNRIPETLLRGWGLSLGRASVWDGDSAGRPSTPQPGAEEPMT